MGWAAREVSSDEVEGLRCFLCCDISVFIPYEFAADVNAKVLGRSDSLEGSAVEVVLCLYWSTFPVKVMTSLLEGLNSVSQSFSHCWRLSRLDWSVLVSCMVLMVWYNRQSSANIQTVEQTVLGRSLM